MNMRGFGKITLFLEIGVLFLLIFLVVILVDPLTVFKKALDTTHIDEMIEMKTAVRKVYTDTSCYPTKLRFGQRLKINDVVYSESIPKSKCSDPLETCYVYNTDISKECAQWSVFFTRLSAPPASDEPHCQLSHLTRCTPKNYDNTRWACEITGNVDCSYLSTQTLP